LQDRRGRTATGWGGRFGGLWAGTARMGGVGLFFAMASLGLPGLASFVGESSFVPCTVHEAHGHTRLVVPEGGRRRVVARATSEGHRSGEAALLVRPEAVTITSADDGLLDGRIEDIMFTGAMTRCIVMLPGGVELRIDAARVDGLDVGDEVGVTWAEEHAVVLDPAV